MPGSCPAIRIRFGAIECLLCTASTLWVCLHLARSRTRVEATVRPPGASLRPPAPRLAHLRGTNEQRVEHRAPRCRFRVRARLRRPLEPPAARAESHAQRISAWLAVPRAVLHRRHKGGSGSHRRAAAQGRGGGVLRPGGQPFATAPALLPPSPGALPSPRGLRESNPAVAGAEPTGGPARVAARVYGRLRGHHDAARAVDVRECERVLRPGRPAFRGSDDVARRGGDRASARRLRCAAGGQS